MIIPDGYGQVNLIYTGAGLPTGAQVTFGIEVPPLSSGTPTDAAEIVRDNVVASTLMANFVNTVQISGVLVKFGPNATGPAAQIATTIVGGGSATGTSPAVSLLVRKNTDQGGRSGRGRMFLPGVSEANVSVAGIIDPTFLTAVQSDLTAFLNMMATDGLRMVLLHGDPSAPITAPLEVTSLTADATAATQRRRQRR